jgi:hypothetical protein
MKTKGIRIYIADNGEKDVLFPDILEEVRGGEALHWSIQFLDGWRKVGDGKIYVCDAQINNSEKGLLVDWKELKAFTADLFDLEEVGVIRCKNEASILRYKNDRVMFESCDVSMVVVDFAYWEVFAFDVSFITRLVDKFKRSVLLNSDFLEYEEK